MSLKVFVQRAYESVYVVGLIAAASSILLVPLVWLGVVGTWLSWQPMVVGLGLLVPALLFRLARPRLGLMWPSIIRRSTHQRVSVALFFAMLVLLLLGVAVYPDAPIKPLDNLAVAKYGAHYSRLHADRFALWQSSYFLVGGAVMIMVVIGTPDFEGQRT